jgi:protocatechuate 3,4-dioxygenase beta subunit
MASQRWRVVAATVAMLVALGVATGAWRAHSGGPSVRSRLSVVIKRDDGAAVPAAVLTVTCPGLTLSARSDRSGRARIALPKKLSCKDLTVRAESAGLVTAERLVKLHGPFPGIGLRLQREAVIAGSVIDETGAPVVAATLEVRAEGDAASAPPRGTAAGDGAGRFAIHGIAPGSYALSARAPLHELAVVPKVLAPSASGTFQVVLVRTSALRGEVWNADGTAAANATVTAAGSGLWPPRSLQTDGSGHFELAPLPAGIYELRAKLGPNVSPPQEGVVLEPAQAAFATLRLAPGASLHGRVLDAGTGLPLVGADVTVVEDALSAVPARTTSDARGEFAVSGLQQQVHRIWAKADGYVSIAGQSLEPGPRQQVLNLLRAGSVRGSVVDEQGQPVAGAEIELVGTAVDGSPMRISSTAPVLTAGNRPPPAGDNLGITEGPIPKVPLVALPAAAGGAPDTAAAVGFTSDARGQFQLTGVAPGKLQVVARHARFAPSKSALVSLAPGGTLADVRVLMTHGVDLVGRVLDARGFPVTGIRVQLQLEGEPSARVTLSAGDGGFAFEAVRGTGVLSAHPLGSPEVRESLQLDGSGTREVVLTLGGEARSLAGRVVDSRDFPVEGALVRVESKNPRSPTALSAASLPDGTFRFDGLPAPPYRLQVERAGFAGVVLAAVTPPSGELRVVLAVSASLAGQVLDRLRGDPVAGAHLQLSPKGAQGSSARTLSSDASGRFEFRDISAGEYTIFIQHSGHVGSSRAVSLPAGQRSELEAFELEPAGVITGDVVDRLGTPVPLAEVAIGDPPAWPQGARADGRGHFRLESVEPGTQELSARHPTAGESARQISVRVYPQQESPGVVVRLPEPLGAQ